MGCAFASWLPRRHSALPAPGRPLPLQPCRKVSQKFPKTCFFCLSEIEHE